MTGAGDLQPTYSLWGLWVGQLVDLLEVRQLIKPWAFWAPPRRHGTVAWSPAGAEGGQANLIQRHGSPRPTNPRPRTDQAATTSAGDRTPLFSPERATRQGEQGLIRK